MELTVEGGKREIFKLFFIWKLELIVTREEKGI